MLTRRLCKRDAAHEAVGLRRFRENVHRHVAAGLSVLAPAPINEHRNELVLWRGKGKQTTQTNSWRKSGGRGGGGGPEGESEGGKKNETRRDETITASATRSTPLSNNSMSMLRLAM